MNKYLSDFVALFYPDLCVGCSSALPRGVQHICVKCRYDLPKTNNHKLEIDSLNHKFQNIVDIKQLLAFCYYQKGGIFQEIIHHLKYENKPELGRMLGRWYADELLWADQDYCFDLVIPVPLHPSKRKKRGYNQAEQISEGLSPLFKSRLVPEALLRVKDERSLTGLGRIERIKGLSETYLLNEATGSELKGKHLLLVDDVMTTGSTLIACYHALATAKPESISFLVLGAAQ